MAKTINSSADRNASANRSTRDSSTANAPLMQVAPASGGTTDGTDRVKSPRVTKLDQLVTLLRRPDGATLAELCDATNWQAHSVRGALAGALKRKGNAIASATVNGTRRYRIEDPA